MPVLRDQGGSGSSNLLQHRRWVFLAGKRLQRKPPLVLVVP
ncbi:MAG: hypothetical protein WB662_08440 [Methyloceanibacter sp.]|jgi:hypothetical protein